MIGRGIDGNDPEQVLFRHGTGYLDAVNGCSVFLILRNDAGHNGVDLRCLKIIKAHIHSADGHGLPCHLRDGVRIRGSIPKEDVGKRRKNHHREHDKRNENSKQALHKKRSRLFDRDGSGAVQAAHCRCLKNTACGSCRISEVYCSLEPRAGILMLLHAFSLAAFGLASEPFLFSPLPS